MKLKKSLYDLSVVALMMGASLILGLLSFGGMYVLFPILSLAVASFILSVVYEGEIYFQNITGALKKLFNKNTVELRIAKDFLQKHLPDDMQKHLLDEMLTHLEKEERDNKRDDSQKNILDDTQKNNMDDNSSKLLAEMRKYLSSGKYNYSCHKQQKHLLDERQKQLLDKLQQHLLANKSNPSLDSMRKKYIDDDKTPQFFKDYLKTLKKLEEYEHKQLDGDSSKRKAKLQADLGQMEAWFTKRLFLDKPNNEIKYQKDVREWISTKLYKEFGLNRAGLNQFSALKELLNTRQKFFSYAKYFSVFTAMLMGLGTTYLLLETFAVIPFLAALSGPIIPALIAPMSLIAGIAYGLLTYNSVTDIIQNETIQKWFRKLKESWTKGTTFKAVFLVVSTILLSLLATALTICTAGTWWTIAKGSKPLFVWMAKIPSALMGVLYATFSFLSALFFNVQNSIETLEIIEEKVDAITKDERPVLTQLKSEVRVLFERLRNYLAQESWIQTFNPFRILAILIFMPLRIIMFIGHLISVGVTGDRVPGIPKAVSAILGSISEGFEDAHYFFGHSHCHGHSDVDLVKSRLAAEHSHSHDGDLPTRLLKGILRFTVYPLATAWDYLASKLPGKHKGLTIRESWQRQTGERPDEAVNCNDDPISDAGQKELIINQLETRCEQLKSSTVLGFGNPGLKLGKLSELQGVISKCENVSAMRVSLKNGSDSKEIKAHRFRFFDRLTFSGSAKTETQEMLDEIVEGLPPVKSV